MPTYEPGQLTTLTTSLAAIQANIVPVFIAAMDKNLRPIMAVAMGNGLYSTPKPGESTLSWYPEEVEADQFNLDVAISAADTTEWDITPIKGLVPGTVLRADAELVRVVSVDYSGGTCVVERGFADTTAEDAVAENATLYSVGVVPDQGADAGDATAVFGSEITNNGHRMEAVVQVTDEGQAMQRTTPEGTVQYEVPKKFTLMSRQLANALYGSEKTGSSVSAMTMDGFRAQISTNTATSVGALVFTDLDGEIEDCINNGGMDPDVLYVSQQLKRELAVWGATNSVESVPATEAGREITRYRSATGVTIDIEADRTIPYGEALLCNRDNLRAGALAPFANDFANLYENADPYVGIRVEQMARTGPSTKLQVLAMFSCQLLHEAAASLLTGITSVDSDGVA